MLRQSTGGGSGGGGGGSGGGGNKLSLGISRPSSSALAGTPAGVGPVRASKSGLMSSDSADVPTSDPHYIMQLVSDVRKFADVLLQLKEVFNSKGMFRGNQHCY